MNKTTPAQAPRSNVRGAASALRLQTGVKAGASVFGQPDWMMSGGRIRL